MTVTQFLPDLTTRPQWVLWRSEKRDGKRIKVPYSVTGKLASSTNPKTWSTYKRVSGIHQDTYDKYSGIGYVFSKDDEFTGIDFDDCLTATEDDPKDRVLKDWARPLLEPFKGTYMEISPSGNGVKIWCKAKLPGAGKKAPYADGAIELYDQGRYFTFTGNICYGAPDRVEDRQQAVEELYALIAGTPKRGDAGVSTDPQRSVLEAPSENFSPTNGHGAPKADLKASGKVTEGGRHDYLVSVAGQYRAKGMDGTEILAALRALNQERCDPPKSKDELVKIVDWVCAKPAGTSRVVEMPPPKEAVPWPNPPSTASRANWPA